MFNSGAVWDKTKKHIESPHRNKETQVMFGLTTHAAAELYEKSPRGMGLRWMNILYEIGQQPGTNTIMLVPSAMPEAGVPTIGMFGFRPVSEGKATQSKPKTET